CIRFLTEIGGVEELGATGRGEDMEITTYVERSLGSELSANIVDLCPVGALTAKPYAFIARPWELHKTESVDVLDAVGSNIRIDSRGAQVLRVLPRLHEDINEEWISDKTRFAHDGLVRRRLDRPYIRRGGRLVEAEWREALDLVADRLNAVPGERIAAIAGDLCDAEAMFAVKMLGDDGATLNALVAGEHPWAELLFGAKAPMLVLGQSALARPDGARVLGAGRAIADLIGKGRPEWSGFNVLHRAAARVAG